MATQFLRPVSSSRTPVSRERFHELVKIKAYELWQSKVVDREIIDWYLAHREHASSGSDPIFHADPRHQKIRDRAKEIYDQRKDADACSDWLEARHNTATKYYVAD